MARIMLVDDEEEIVNLLSVILEMYGYDVRGYHDAETALSAAERDMPDLLLVDLMMPGMDGLQLVNCIDHLPAVAGTPALLLTGLAPSDEQLARLVSCPGIGMLEKPCDPDRIAQEVERLLNQAASTPDFRHQVSKSRQGCTLSSENAA